LALTSRETRSLLAANPGVVTFGQVANEVVEKSTATGGDDFVARNVLLLAASPVLLQLTDDSDGDVVVDCSIEEHARTLRDASDVTAKPFFVDPFETLLVDLNPTVLRSVETKEELPDGRLAGSRSTDDIRRLASGEVEADVVEGGGSGCWSSRVVEGDVAKGELAGEHRGTELAESARSDAPSTSDLTSLSQRNEDGSAGRSGRGKVERVRRERGNVAVALLHLDDRELAGRRRGALAAASALLARKGRGGGCRRRAEGDDRLDGFVTSELHQAGHSNLALLEGNEEGNAGLEIGGGEETCPEAGADRRRCG
jgi:hypothetical protein